jgi:hypothetical protein
MARSVDFITDSTGLHWLPRPSSWLGGMARHWWFQYHMGPCRIASPDYFKALSDRFGVHTITEADDGTITLTLPNPANRSLP